MNKRGVVQWLWVALLGFVFLWVFTSVLDPWKIKVQDGSLLSKFTSEHETTNIVIQEKILTQTITEKVHLCNVMMPYIVPSDIQNQCIINGGTWTCTSEFVGCTNLPAPIITCGGPAYISAYYQCEQLGGSAYCDSTNLYCTY